jgi:hypothetical protein
MTLDEFVPLVGRTLHVDTQPAAVELVLVEASPLPHAGRRDRPPFILVFRSAPEVLLVDGTYAMRGQGFGPDAIGIGSLQPPIGAEPGYYYQAVFN